MEKNKKPKQKGKISKKYGLRGDGERSSLFEIKNMGKNFERIGKDNVEHVDKVIKEKSNMQLLNCEESNKKLLNCGVRPKDKNIKGKGKANKKCKKKSSMKFDEFDLRPNPIISGKNAERFYEHINGGKIEKQQEEFLKRCVKLLKETKQ